MVELETDVASLAEDLNYHPHNLEILMNLHTTTILALMDEDTGHQYTSKDAGVETGMALEMVDQTTTFLTDVMSSLFERRSFNNESHYETLII